MRNGLIAIAITALFASAWTARGQDKPDDPCGEAASGPQNARGKDDGRVFWVADRMKRDIVSFKSSAPLEDIVGTTSDVRGHFVFNPERPEAGVRGEFCVSVSTLSTGIKLRDEHLKGADWLDAKTYPEIRYVIDGTRSLRLEKRGDGFSTWDVTVTGALSLHGEEKRIEVGARLTYLKESEATHTKLPGDLLACRAHLGVRLSEFGVKGFKGFVGSKVSDTIEIDVSVFGSSVRPPGADDQDDPGGKGAEKATTPDTAPK